MDKIKPVVKVVEISYGKLPLKKIAQNVQKMYDEMIGQGFRLTSINSVGAKGNIYVWEKLEMPNALNAQNEGNPLPDELLQALFGGFGGKPPPGVKIITGKGPMPEALKRALAEESPFSTPGFDDEPLPSPELRHFIDVIAETMSKVTMLDDRDSMLEDALRKLTMSMPVNKMHELSNEICTQIDYHKKHCNDPKCEFVPTCTKIRESLEKNAKLNTQ